MAVLRQDRNSFQAAFLAAEVKAAYLAAVEAYNNGGAGTG